MPTPEVIGFIEFLLTALAIANNMKVFAFCMLSNQYHGLFDDPDGNYPNFIRDFHARLANGIKTIEAKEEGRPHMLGRVFDGQQPKRIFINDMPTLLEKIDYIMNQPVASGATETGDEWQGVRFAFGMTTGEGWDNGRKIVKRPEGLVAKSQKYPDEVVLEPARPPGFESADDAAKQIRDVVSAGEKRDREERQREGLGFASWDVCVNLSRRTTPTNQHDVGTYTPRHSSAIKEERRAQFKAEETWLQAYAAAWRDRANPNTVFPFGTYYQRVYELRDVEDLPLRL